MQPKHRPTYRDVTQPIRVRWVSKQPVVPHPYAGNTRQMVRNPGLPPMPANRAVPRPPQRYAPQGRVQNKSRSMPPLLWLLAGMFFLMVMSCGALTLGMGVIYAGGILPGVRAGGVPVGGLSQAQAGEKIQAAWQTITIQDSERTWQLDPAVLGISVDSSATARSAYEAGRGDLSTLLPGIVGQVDIAPSVSIDPVIAQAGLVEMASQFEQPPENAGVQLVNGSIQTTPAINGRVLDINATLAQLQGQGGEILADGTLELVMQVVLPSVTDATPMVDEARQLLSNPFELRVYDPVTGDSVYWSALPQEWVNWITTMPDSSKASGLSLTADGAKVQSYLNHQAGVLDASRYIDIDDAVEHIQASIASGSTSAYTRVYHRDRQHVVQAGETIISIAWDYGIPYLFLQEANGGLESVSVGQTITIPPADTFLKLPVNPDKRIVVSISEQRTHVYENGGLKWDWIASTGISSSPTWPGIYQVISHEPNAYAGNWNLWMPNFLGVYKPIPGADFTNGFHGFPTRGSSQLLWTNSLGTRVTYGCILLSNENAQALYNWAEEGVVVEILP